MTKKAPNAIETLSLAIDQAKAKQAAIVAAHGSKDAKPEDVNVAVRLPLAVAEALEKTLTGETTPKTKASKKGN